jgi:hypothetical protein
MVAVAVAALEKKAVMSTATPMAARKAAME